MSKNEEKAHAMLNRWVAMKKELNSRSKDKRPKMSTECNNLQECEKWRNQIIKDITKKVANIQNASLGEYKLRELNDEINKLFREKFHWEDRIKELGGPDYKKLAPRAIDKQGQELSGSGGYKYWGAAKDLPGVRELFAKEIPNAPKKSRADLYKNINFEYYGFLDEEDELLIKLEKIAEEKMLQEYFEDNYNGEGNLKNNKKRKIDENTSFNPSSLQVATDEEYLRFKILHTPDQIYKSYYEKPNEEDIEKLILEKKKAQLIKMYNLEELENFEKQNNDIMKDNKIINNADN